MKMKNLNYIHKEYRRQLTRLFQRRAWNCHVCSWHSVWRSRTHLDRSGERGRRMPDRRPTTSKSWWRLRSALNEHIDEQLGRTRVAC